MNDFFTEKIRVALLDDHPIVRKGFELVLDEEKDFSLVGSFGKSNELISFLESNEVDVVVLDYLLGEDERDGLTLLKKLLKNNPKLKILMVSSVESIVVVRLAMRLGVCGYIGKSKDTSILIKALRSVAKGKIYVSPDLEYELSLLNIVPVEHIPYGQRKNTQYPSELASRLDGLSPKEAEVIRYFLEGMTVLQIALKFKRSRKTVSGQKQSAMKKLGIKTDAELFMFREFIL